jgi:hypothetical protein
MELEASIEGLERVVEMARTFGWTRRMLEKEKIPVDVALLRSGILLHRPIVRWICVGINRQSANG